MARTSSVYWLAPATMLGALVAGIVFAAGHHCYYKSLDGEPASNTAFTLFGSAISTQETSTAIGTAFAFLVKASLVLAISVAFIQVFWMVSRVDGGAKQLAPTLAQLDLAISAMDNMLMLFHLPTCGRYPLLLLLALTAW